MARVLIVDDDADFREVVSVILEVAGHDTRLAPDGREALRVVQEWAPDVVLLDMFMPNMDGLETVVAVRRASSRVKLIAMSGGWGRPDDSDALHVLDQAVALGADTALRKPFDRNVLRRLIEELVGAGGP
jgi:CheY-like chemotaxis protein